MKFSVVVATIGVMLAAGPVFGGMAVAQQTVTAAPVQVAAVVPLSMRYFCAQNKSQCETGTSGSVEMSANLMSLLKQVNGRVNGSIRPQADGADVWSLNPASGDCEDFVLTKRGALIDRGVPAGSLRIAYTHTPNGAPHAVLLVRTSQGDYVLDNLTHAIKTLRASGYTIRSMSSADPTKWAAS